MNRHARRSARGFTLIELMLVVGIIGILASIAVPEFQNVIYRARIAERETLMRAIAKSVEDITLNSPARAAGFQGAMNPPGTPSPEKRIWTQASAGWRELPVMIDGSTYCSYQFRVVPTTGDNMQLHVWGFCDIDGDGNQNQKELIYDVVGHALVLDQSRQPPEPPTNVF
jgi:prepilin-type N-terminal cleavage/methylation domain-containing protein